MIADAVLSAMPGNVLRSHGRDHIRLLGLQFTNASAAERAFVRGLPVTSAATQGEAARAFRNGEASQLFAAVFLAFSAYRRCDIALARSPGDPAFQLGMPYASRHRLSDPSPETWESAYRVTTDLAVLLAHDGVAALDTEFDRLTAAAIASGLAVTFSERGTTLRDPHGNAMEHFGFVDGISQPRLDSLEDAKRMALVSDPGCVGGWGSYVVFRKLRQDLAAFARAIRRLGGATGLDDDRAAALLLGRFRDGRPAHHGTAQPGALDAGYDYVDDPGGRGCPIGAHARRMNPRDEAAPWHQIVRRGVPYGAPPTECGLLFLAYQQDISRQFEFLQGVWARGRDGFADAILGGERGVRFYCQPGDARVSTHLPELTRLRGGAYWFAPCPKTVADWP